MKNPPPFGGGFFLPVEAPLNHHYEIKGNYNFNGRIISIH
jgi:hypothetical protein